MKIKKQLTPIHVDPQGRPSWQPLDSPLWQVWQRGVGGIQADGGSTDVLNELEVWNFEKIERYEFVCYIYIYIHAY